MFACDEIPQAANDNEPACVGCGTKFKFRRGKLYCSRTCMIANRDKHKSAPERECVGCGTSFRRRSDSKNAAKYCSRDCAFANGGSGRPRLVSPENKKIAETYKVSYSVARCVCSQCGSRFTGVSLASNVCSTECERRKYVAANDNKVDRTPRPCAECGVMFSPVYGVKNRKFCSDDCGDRSARRTTHRKRRAKLRNVTVESVNPTNVFDRDGWRCQFCKVKTPRKLRGTYAPNAPELDHIVPLSCGGEHSYINTQCLCRSCNALKSNNIVGQLRLFG